MPDLAAITSVAIYPSIGIARVGNSPTDYFFGPEVPGPHPKDPGNFRDAQGRIKRQAARFRVYGLNANGEIVKEITADDGEITWTVQVANKKAAWYDFKQAFDIPASQGKVLGLPAIASNRRNPGYGGVYRKQLAIDPGARSISGRTINADGAAAQYAFGTGKFFTKQVYLGELRTDDKGNLIFLGGRGVSASRAGEPIVAFANNNGWYDDTSDGPVDATVKINGQVLQATGAWVIVAPPNYAPGVPAIVTGYDLIFEAATKLNPGLKPAKPAFFKHIYPLLKRFTLNQWVNGGMARDFGWGSTNDFTRPELIAQLSNPSDASRPLRQALFARFRNPNYQVKQPDALPPFYGDGTSFNVNTRDPREWMAVLELQYAWLAQWAAGDFVVDAPPPLKSWDAMTPAERASALDQAVLDETIGGPFHPGCEFTWPMRLPMMYATPFRIKRRAKPEPDWGALLTYAIALKAGGPLDGSGPGDISRWMAIPWQADTASCLSAYPFGAYFRDYQPTFWPARVPNDVMTQENYQIVVDPKRTKAEKDTAFSLAARRKWLRNIAYTATLPARLLNNRQAMVTFLQQWDKIAIVTQQPGPPAPSPFPSELWVETGRLLPVTRALAAATPAATESDVLPTSDVAPLEDDSWAEENPITLR